MKKIILVIAVLTGVIAISSLYADDVISVSTTAISWIYISDPGFPNDIGETEIISGETVDTPSVDEAPTPLSEESKRELSDRIRRHMEKRYPPVLLLTINLPDDALEADKVVIEARMPYSDGVLPSYCLQLIVLDSDAPELSASSTVCDAQNNIDLTHAITATPDPDGIFRFDITGLVSSIDSRDIGNRFTLKPFQYRDKFDIPEYGSQPFALVMIN